MPDANLGLKPCPLLYRRHIRDLTFEPIVPAGIRCLTRTTIAELRNVV